MPNRKETIVISVLCVLALMLGYWTGPLFDDNGDEETSVKPVVDDNATKTVRKLTAEEEKQSQNAQLKHSGNKGLLIVPDSVLHDDGCHLWIVLSLLDYALSFLGQHQVTKLCFNH